jgi:hypothetical protein
MGTSRVAPLPNERVPNAESVDAMRSLARGEGTRMNLAELKNFLR